MGKNDRLYNQGYIESVVRENTTVRQEKDLQDKEMARLRQQVQQLEAEKGLLLSKYSPPEHPLDTSSLVLICVRDPDQMSYVGGK